MHKQHPHHPDPEPATCDECGRETPHHADGCRNAYARLEVRE